MLCARPGCCRFHRITDHRSYMYRCCWVLGDPLDHGPTHAELLALLRPPTPPPPVPQPIANQSAGVLSPPIEPPVIQVRHVGGAAGPLKAAAPGAPLAAGWGGWEADPRAALAQGRSVCPSDPPPWPAMAPTPRTCRPPRPLGRADPRQRPPHPPSPGCSLAGAPVDAVENAGVLATVLANAALTPLVPFQDRVTESAHCRPAAGYLCRVKSAID